MNTIEQDFAPVMSVKRVTWTGRRSMVELAAMASSDDPIDSWPRVQISNEERGIAGTEERTNLPKLRRYAAFTSYSLGFDGGTAGVAAGIRARSNVAVRARAAANIQHDRVRRLGLNRNRSVEDLSCILSPSKN